MTAAGMGAGTEVYLEVGAKRVFASAARWPGWCRAGKGEEQALAALAASAGRYAAVAAAARLPFAAEAGGFEVVERLPGTATTDFGAPGVAAARESAPLDVDEAARLAAILEAAWGLLDTVVASAPPGLRKGPRGGGRDRDAVFQHLVGAEAAYAGKIGIRVPEPPPGDHAAMLAMRDKVLDALRLAGAGSLVGATKWPVRYAVRRFAWHLVDHAWEIEDRT